MEEADWTRVEAAAFAFEVVAAEAVLVPAVVDGADVAGEDEEEGRERTKVVDTALLLDCHPVLHLLGELTGPPLFDVDDHDAGVEVAGLSRAERL